MSGAAARTIFLRKNVDKKDNRYRIWAIKNRKYKNENTTKREL